MGHLGRTQKSQAASEKKLKAYACELERKLEERTHELAEARQAVTESLAQPTATSDVLKVISRSTFDLQTVLDTLVESAAHLCDAYDSAIWRPDGDRLLLVAHHGPILAKSLPLIRGTVAGRTVLDGRSFHIADLQIEDAEFPESSENARRWGFHALLCVPLMREGFAIGTIALRRNEALLFTERQVALLQTFAEQAAIAIENVRLLNELRESLQQQTATADALKVISRSSFDLQAVLDALVESAARLCEADLGSITRQKNKAFWQVASYGYPPALIEYMRNHPIELGRGSLTGRTALERRVIQIPDILADPEYKFVEPSKIGGYRTMLGVPLLREAEPIGVIVLMRRTVCPFTDKQIELVTTFADSGAGHLWLESRVDCGPQGSAAKRFPCNPTGDPRQTTAGDCRYPRRATKPSPRDRDACRISSASRRAIDRHGSRRRGTRDTTKATG